MKRSQLRDVSMEIMVGAFIFMILLALGFFTIILSYENIFQQYHPLEVQFDHVSGLRQGDNVFLRGVMIGRVRQLEVDDDGVRVTASIQRRLTLREGYRIEIVPSSVLGGQYLAIDEGPPDAPRLPDDARLRGERPVDLIDEATHTIRALRASLEEGEVLANVEATMAQLNDITRALSEGQGTFGRLLMEDAVYQDLEQLTANLRSVSEKINAGEGTLGKLIADDEMYEEAQLLLREIRASIDDFRETAPITTFTSIFFGAF